MTKQLVCWKCGASIAGLPMPLSRLSQCKSCEASLYVCKMCQFYDTKVSKQCREPVAEEVKDKTRANFCDYFQVKPAAYVAPEYAQAQASKTELEALFGLSVDSVNISNSTDAADAELKKLFDVPDKK